MPSVEFPPATPFTLHVSAVERDPAPVTVAVNACPAPVETLADVGEIVTMMLSVMVTAAEPTALASAALAAATVTAGGDGRLPGAMYKPVEETVPRVEFPPATPFTDQVTVVFEVPATAA